MLLSNKLTFCITVFILLAFAIVPVMAHQPPSGQTFAESHDGVRNSDTQDAAEFAAETGHRHHATVPTVSSITAEDITGAVTAGGTLVSSVDGRDIALVSDADGADDARVVIPLAGGDATANPVVLDSLAAGEFVLKITFNEDVYTSAGADANTAPALAAGDLEAADITLIAAAADNPNLNIGIGTTGTNFSITTVARVDTTPDDTADNPASLSKREFLVTVAVSAGFTSAQTPVSIWINVAADQVFSPTLLINGDHVQGRGNAEYRTPGTEPFSLDGYEAPPPPGPTPREEDAPTVEIVAPARVTTPGSTANLSFTLTFNEAIVSLVQGDLTITGGTFVSATANTARTVWTVAVDPAGDPANTEVTVTLNDQSVSDESGNRYTAPTAGPDSARYDTVNPTVHPTATGTIDANGAGTLNITFSEALGSGAGGFMNADIDRTNSNVLLTNTEPTTAATQPTDGTQVWDLMVTNVTGSQAIVVIKAGSVMDAANNPLLRDTIVTWTRPAPPADETDDPVVTIALAGGMTYIDSVSGGNVMITATDNVGVTNQVEAGEITVTRGAKGAFANNMLMVTPHVAQTTVEVSVAADAAMDAAGNGSAAVSMTFNVGPIFTVPAGAGRENPGYLVITKTTDSPTHTYLSDQPTLHRTPLDQSPPTPAPNLTVGVWSNMPDLERLFNTTSGNGGTLNIKAAGTHPTEGTGSGTGDVRITEVMWAIDEFKRGGVNDAQAAEQWIEVENANAHPVHIIIYARTGRDSAINTADGHIDRVGNAYNGGPGSAPWPVPGSNGNSYTGVDFVSMWRRHHKDNNKNHYENGTGSGNWRASTTIYLTSATANDNDGALYNHVGTPGRLQSVKLPLPSTKAGVTNVPSSPFIINEVANRDNANAKYEWIEIKNVTGSEQNLRNYILSKVTAVGTDDVLIHLPNNDNTKVPAGGVILLLASDPRHDDDHPIAPGYNVDVNRNDQVDGLGLIVEGSNRQPPRQKVVDFRGGGLPDDGAFILLLRRPDHPTNGDHAERGEADIDKIVDIAGHHEGLSKSNYPATTPTGLNNTTLWPLVNYNGDMRPNRGHGDWNHRRHNRFEANRVRYRQHQITKALPGKDGASNNRGGTGFTHKNRGVEHYAFRDTEYTGLGYRRTARANVGYHNGTPGYDGNRVGNTGVVKATADTADVTISEIMTSTGPNADRAVYPQWIELYNSSPTNAVSLKNWKLQFEMLDAEGNPMDSLMNLDLNRGRVKTIPPQQTMLIVASRSQANSDSRAGTDVFNDNRVFNVQRDVGLGKFGANTRYMFFNPKAFSIALLDKDNKVVDRIGNLDGDARTSDTNDWDFPAGVAADGNRTSFIRVYDDADGRAGAPGVARAGVNETESNVMPIFGMGDKKMKDKGIDAKYSWIPAVNTQREFKITIKSTWYGNEDDYGTPNNRPGMVLPVELSFFRPTLEDGVVTIRWTTESELDNAGFNILRSETRNGEYKQVNAEMIQGAGTTGERSSYKWVDQTAKPGVVYYYQIEDVSFAGERQALAITKLKGLISADNKLTTTWSELKQASQ